MPSTFDKHHATNRTLAKRLATVFLVTILAGLLVACAEETGPDEDRRFANDRVTVEPTATQHAGERNTVEAPTATSPGAGEALVTADDASPTIAFADQGGFRIVQNQGAITTTHVELDDTERLLDLATSRDGTQIAALIRRDDSGTADMRVRLFDRSGAEVAEWDLSAWSTVVATPEAQSTHGLLTEGSLSWSFDGSRLLATIGGTSLVDIEVGGDLREILVTSRAGTLVDAAWSPDGSQVALHAINDAGTGTVWVFNPGIDGDSFQQVIPPPADAANLGSVVSVQWEPTGHGLTYILAADSAAPGGQLFSLDLDSTERHVVATPGRGGPAAQIVEFAVAPDGSAVAYTIWALDDDEWEYHSTWIRSTESSAFFEVPTGIENDVNAFWWLGTGFAWTHVESDGQRLEFMAQGLEPIDVPLAADGSTSLVATPVQASPVASPVASGPDGTPVGNASPVASTPISATPTAP